MQRISLFLPMYERRLTLATLLTLTRIFLIPFIVSFMIMQLWACAWILCAVAATTDAVDGYVARRFQEQTLLGAVLDPIADKALVISVLATLSLVDHSPLHVSGWFVLFLVIKELIQIAGAALLVYHQGILRIKPTPLAKITALIQMVFIIWLLACYHYGWLPLRTYYFTVATVFILQILVLIHYAVIGFSSMKESA